MASFRMENPTDKDRLLLKHQLSRRFQWKDDNASLPYYYRARQVEPCHQLGWIIQGLFLSNWALDIMPYQQQRAHDQIYKTE